MTKPHQKISVQNIDDEYDKLHEEFEKLKDTAVFATGIEMQVIRDIEARQKQGLKKYGQTVDKSALTLRQWLQHAYEEHLDACIYLKKAIKECE